MTPTEMAAMAERINRATPEDIIRATRRLREQGQHEAVSFALEFEAMGNSASTHALNNANSASTGESKESK